MRQQTHPINGVWSTIQIFITDLHDQKGAPWISIHLGRSHILRMAPPIPHLLAMPSTPPETLPQPEDLDGVGALLYCRPPGGRNLRLEACRDVNGQAAPIRGLPMRLRKISGSGIIEGRYGRPRSQHIQSFTDWTVYGRAPTHRDSRSDVFAITQHFVAHGQHDLSGAPIQPSIGRTRYSAPLYQLDGKAALLPVYLRSSLTPPCSAHERLEHFERFGGQLRMIFDLLGVPFSTTPELTWLHPRNYP